MAPRNPLTAAWDYLRGNDLKVATSVPPPYRNPFNGVPRGMERKFIYYDGPNAAIRMGTLVHGPGATELLGQAFGNWGQDANSAVFACLSYLCRSYPAAPLRVYRGDPGGGEPDVLPDHPLEDLFARPNPDMTGPEVWYWVQWAKHVTGNAYLRKIRAGDEETGNVVQLRPISPAVLYPVTTKSDRRQGISVSYYRHEYETGKYEDISPENIVHFRFGIDDFDHRLGCSPLKRLARSVSTDEEAQAFTNALLKNYAIPGLVVMTKDPEMTPEDAEKIKENVSSKFGTDKRGQVGVLINGATVEQFGFSPEQMDMKTLHRVPEERIAAVMGVPATLVGLGAGLDRSIYNNVREAREGFTENTLLPLYTFDAATVDLRLLPDFTSDRRIFTRFDISNLRALQEDTDKIWARAVSAFEKRLITKNEARAEINYLPVDGGDEFEEPKPPPQLPAPRATVTEVPRERDQGKALERKQRIDPERFPDLFAAMVDLAAPALEEQLKSYFEGQRRRVVARLTAGEADPATARAALPSVR